MTLLVLICLQLHLLGHLRLQGVHASPGCEVCAISEIYTKSVTCGAAIGEDVLECPMLRDKLEPR